MAREPTTGPTETNTSATGSPTNAPARVSSTGPAATATREISSRENSTARASTTGPTETVTRESSRTAISTVTVLNTMPTAPARPAGGNTTISWDKRPYRKSGRPTIQTPAFQSLLPAYNLAKTRRIVGKVCCKCSSTSAGVHQHTRSIPSSVCGRSVASAAAAISNQWVRFISHSPRNW